MKKFKLLSMSFILSISAIAGLSGQSYAATYDISGGYLHSTTNIRSENRGNVVIGTTNNGNNNYGYGAAILGVGLDTGMYLVAPGGGTELSCTKQLDGYFIINFTNFLMLPLDSTTRSTVVGNGLIDNGVKIMEGGLFYECSNKNNSNTKYPGIYGYIKRKYGDNEHKIRAGLDSSNKRATSSPLQLIYGNDYPNTYRTLSGTIYDSLMSGNITIEPRTIGLVGIENYQSIGGSINNPTYYVSNTQALKIYTKYSHSTDGKFVRLTLTGYDRNGQVTIPNTIGGVQGLILSGTAANKISHSDGINLRTNVSVSVGPKDFGLYGYNSQNYSKLENLASGTITLKLGNDWTQSINFIVSGANCSGNDIQINPTGCYAGNKTVTISCITGNLHAQAYQRDNNGSRSSQNFYTVSANGQHNVKVKDLRGHETVYSFEITGIISNGGLTAPTNPSANPLTGNDTTPTLSWNASDDSTCNSGNTITYKVWVCENSTCSSAVRSGTTTNTSRDVTSALPNTAGKRYYFKIQAGNGHDSSSFSSVGTFFLDTTAPTIQITNPTAACKTGKTVSATATDTGGAGVASLQRVMTGSSTCTGTTTNNWTTYTNPINLSEADSGKYICFKAVDNAGNINFSKSNQITGIDLSGPIGTITIAKACYTGTTIPLQLSAQDVGCSTVKQMQFSCDGTNWSTGETYSTTKSFKLGNYASYGCTTADGDKTIYVRYKDNIGNRGNAVSTGVRVDTTPPTVTSFTTDIPVCSKGTTSGQITITRSETIGSNIFTISELTIKSGQARSARTTENNPTYIGYISYPVGNVLNYGSTTVTIGKKVVNDTCGNPNTTTTGISLEFDLAGPSKPTPTSGIGCMNTVTPTLTWTESNDVGCSNSIGGYEIQVCANNTCTNVKKTGSTTTTSWTVPSGLSNNTQYYRRVRAKDGLGNRGDWSDATGFKADTTGPTTTSSISPSNRSCTNQNVTVTLSGNDNGCNGSATTYYCIGSNACTPTTQGTTAQITATDGSTASGYVGFYSIDGFGNTGSTQYTNKISIDKAGPNKPTGGENLTCTGARPTLTWSAPSDIGCNNTISGYEIWICTDNACTIATKTGTSTTTSWKVPSGLTSGKYYWKVRAKDGLGNWGSFSSIWSFTIDTSAPAAPTVNDIKPLSCNNSTTVTVSGTTVQDVGCAGGVQYKFCMTTKATATNCTESSWSTTPTATFNNLENGTTYNFFIKSKDGFGTESNWSTTYKSYTVDQIAPTTTIDLSSNWKCSPNDIDVSFNTNENGCNSDNITYYYLDTSIITGGSNGITSNELHEQITEHIIPNNIYTRPIQITAGTGTANGTDIYYYSKDGLDNSERINNTGLVQIDKAGPTYTVQIEQGYECQKITATIGRPEDVGCAGIGSEAYSWDGGRTFTGKNSYTLGQNEVGTQVINVVVKDKFDNTTAQTVTYEWIDSPLNVESDTYVGSDNVGKETIKLDRYDLIHPKAGICETIKASVIGSKNNLGTCTINDSILIFEPRHDTIGDDVCILELTDGDTKVEVSVEFNRIDTVAPTCGTRTYKPTLTTCTSGSVTATLKNSTDIGRGIEREGGTCNISEYNKTCNVTIQDKAGNTTVCTSAAATNIDVTPPTITTVTNANGYECDTITGSIVATDPNPRCGSLTYSWNGGSFGSATKYGLRQTTTGTQTIIVKVKDSAGNMTSTGVKYTWKDVVLTANDFSVNGVCGEMTVDRNKLSKAQAGSCETITATINTQGQKGKCEIDKDNITYIPNSNATGSDTCVIAITDGDTTKNITITWNDIDTLPPTLTMITNASGCVKGGKYTVTGTWSELVNGFEIKDITANIGTVGEDFTFAKNPTYAWFVTSPSSEYGKTEVNVDKNVVTDMCKNNTNTSSSSIHWEYDNAAPKVTVDTTKATVPECTVGTASITDVQQVGCAPEHPTPYSRDAGTTYGRNIIKTGYLGTSGHITYTLRVRDNLGNYAPKNITFKWTDTKPTIKANAISYGTLTGTHTDNWFNTINLVTDMDVIDGACGTGTVTLKSVSNCSTNLIADAKTGANNIVQLKAIDQVEGRASCTVTFVDDEGSTVSTSIYFDVDTKKPVCTRGEPQPLCMSGNMGGSINLTCTDAVGISQTSISASNVTYPSTRLTLSNSNTVAGTKTGKTFTFTYTAKTTAGTTGIILTLKANAIKDISTNGNTATTAKTPINIDNQGPTITFKDLATDECHATSWSASAKDNGCAGLDDKTAYKFSSTSFGNNNRGGATLSITKAQVPSAGSKTQNLTVIDTLGNTNSASATLTINDVRPSFDEKNGGKDQVEVGNITGVHLKEGFSTPDLKEGFTTPDLIALMKPIDGDCGSGPMTLVDVKCDENIITKATVNKDNTVTLIPVENIEIDSKCLVTFQDDEGNTLEGQIMFHIDTLNPTIKLISDADGSCEKGDIARNVEGTWSEKVLGFIQSDITSSNGTIGLFKDKNPIFTWTITSPTTSYGSTNVHIKDNVATDQLGNPNVEGSNKLNWNYDNACPTITFSNTSTNECTATSWSASATDNGCAGLDANTAYKFSSTNFGNNNRGGATLNITANQVPSAGSKTQTVTVKDKLGNSCDKSATLTINDVKPSMTTKTLTYNTKSTSINTATNIYTNLITSMGVKDGNCGANTISKTGNISCNRGSAVRSGNGITVTPPSNAEGSDTCTVTFADDEKNTITGSVTYYYDTKKPVCTRGEPQPLCMSGNMGGSINLTCTDAVGISQTSISASNVTYPSTRLTLSNSNTVAGTKTGKTFTFTYTAKTTAGTTGIILTLKANAIKDISTNGNTATTAKTPINIDNQGPKVDFEDTNLDECTATTWTAKATDIGCAGMKDEVAFMFGKEFGNNTRQNNMLTIKANQVPNAGTKDQTVIVRDSLGNTNSASATLTINDVRPSFDEKNGGKDQVGVGNITGVHLKEGFTTKDLIELMKPIDGDCGSGPMTLIDVICEKSIITKATVNKDNTVTLIPVENIEKDNKCIVIFQDDEGNTLEGQIMFHIDTLNPTIDLSSNGTNSCKKGGTVRNMTGKRSEPVIGFIQSDITVTNLTIGGFMDKYNPTFTWTGTSPTSSWGTSTVVINTNVATDQLGNPNTQGSNTITRQYDNAGPTYDINNPTVAECTTGIASVTNVQQIGCSSSYTNAYRWYTGGSRTSYAASSTYSLYKGSQGTQSARVRVRDTLNNYTQKTFTFTWTNTAPSITTNNYSVGTLTGTHTGNRFNTTNLVTAMNVIDGACGNSTITLKSVSNCSSTYIASSQTGANNIVQLKAKNGVEGTGTCTVTFVDDEGSTVAGTIKFYVDSKHPTVTLASNGTNSCQKATTYTVTGTFTEAVQGVEQSDLSITNGLIKGFTFNNKTEKEAVRTVRSNESGYGWLSISIPANKFTDKYNNINIQASQGASGRNYDNACPTITFEDKKVDECTAIKREASAKDNGCAGLNDKDAYMFSKKTSFGNDEWGNNILNIVASQIPNAIGKEKEQIVTVRDTLGNQCDATAKLIINNVAPTITTNNYSVGTLTGTHTGNWFNTTNLVTAMNVKDGNCGTGTITLKSVSNCSSTYIASSQTGANNIVQLKAKNGVEGSGTCTVTFVDDEGTTVTGTIKFYVDSKHPTVTLTSNGTNSCQKATTYTVTGTFTEAVQGVEQSDLIVKSGSIQSFNIKSNNLAVRTVRSNESGYGWLSISIPSNRFTDMYNNINIQASLGASGRNFDNAAPEQPIIDRENSSSCIAGNKVTIVAQTVHDYGCASGVQYQFCKSTNNNTNDCKSVNLSSRSASNSYQAKNLSNNTPYYFFVRAKDGLNNQTEWSPAYGTIESLSAYDFTGYFNYEREEPGPYKVTVNRKRKSYASAGICENIQITKIDCNNGTSTISGDELIYTTVDDIKTWVALHQKAQNEELYCNLTISDGNTSKNIRASFQIKFDDIYLNPVIITGNSVIDYSGQIELSADRTTKYTNKAGIALQINGGFISKDPERHRYRASCNKKDWSEWKQYPSDGGRFDWDLVDGDGKTLEGCDTTEGNRKVHIQLCDSPTKTLCTEKATRLGN